jgi:hypothetical protein
MRPSDGCKQFTYDHYEDTLKLAKQSYAIGPFRESEGLAQHDRYIILRHDIDFSIDHALRMAALEHRLGIKSTYFVLLHSSFYNPLTEESRNKLMAFVQMGHELGLHYDPRFAMVQNEVELLASYLNTRIETIARHNSFGVKIDVDKQDKLTNAYDSQFFKEIKYISDSSQYWREGCMCHHVGIQDRMQILVHPEWWGEKTVPPDQILLSLKDSLKTELDSLSTVAVANLQLHREKMFKGLV